MPKAVHKIVDVKCPGAGSAANSFRLENLEALTNKRRSQIRHLPIAKTTSSPATSSAATRSIKKPDGILLSPAFTKTPSPQRTADNMALDPRKLVEWMLADGLPARLSLQIHKFIWEPMKKGV